MTRRIYFLACMCVWLSTLFYQADARFKAIRSRRDVHTTAEEEAELWHALQRYLELRDKYAPGTDTGRWGRSAPLPPSKEMKADAIGIEQSGSKEMKADTIGIEQSDSKEIKSDAIGIEQSGSKEMKADTIGIESSAFAQWLMSVQRQPESQPYSLSGLKLTDAQTSSLGALTNQYLKGWNESGSSFAKASSRWGFK